jgi:hypothetical protein
MTSPSATLRSAASSACTRRCLVHDAVGLCCASCQDQRWAGVGGIYDHGRRLWATFDAPTMRKPVVAREVMVEDHDVRTHAVELTRELWGAGRGGCNGEVWLGIDQPT